MKALIRYYQIAYNRFIEAEYDKLSDDEKNKEICYMKAFMIERGCSKNYLLFRYAITQALNDDEIIKAMRDEINE